MKKLLLAISIILLSTSLAVGQKNKSFLTVGVSSNTYVGDLSQGFEKWTASFHLGLKFHRAKLLNGQFNISFGTITGQNSGYLEKDAATSPNRFFSTQVITANYDMQINLLKSDAFALYLSQGIGMIHYIPKDQYYAPLQEQAETRASNETYGNTAIILPTQLGAFYIFNNGYGVGLQGGILNTVTDYLDNISEWGTDSGNDNIFMGKVMFYVPLN